MRIKNLSLLLALVACGPSTVSAPKDAPTKAPAPREVEAVGPTPSPAPASPAPQSPGLAPAEPDEAGPDEWPITIVNTSKRPIVLWTSGCNREPGWFKLAANGTPLDLTGGCFCENLIDGSCPARPAVCARSEYEVVKPGASFTHRWNASHVVLDPQRGCAKSTKLRRNSLIDVEVCWFDRQPQSADEEMMLEQRCAKVRVPLAGRSGVTLSVAPSR